MNRLTTSLTEMRTNKFHFKHPFCAILAGPSKAGKTEFLIRLFENYTKMIEPEPNVITYCYKIWQEKFERMKEFIPDIRFHEGIIPEEEIDVKKINLVISDDFREW